MASRTFSILNTHLRIFKNWFFYEDNGKAVILSGIILFLLLLFLFAQSKTVITLIIFAMPILTTNAYLKLTLKENNFLLGFFDKKTLLGTKQFQAILSNLIVFSLVLFVQIVFTPIKFSSINIIFVEVFFLTIIGFLHPNFIKENRFSSGNAKENSLWNLSVPNQKLLPIRSIINREILFLWRANKNLIIKYILSTFLINAIFILFIINNSKEDFFVWAVFLQFVFLLNLVLHFPTHNNLKLANSYPCNSSSILKGELVFWTTLFLVHLFLIVATYSFFLTDINLLLTLILFLVILFLLAYTLLIRLTYADNIGTRVLTFIMLAVPITIPFTIYNCYKKLKC